MRKDEVAQVCATAKKAGIDLHVVNASDYFFDTIGDTISPEEKRKRFKEAYTKTFEKIIVEQKITHLIQGTLATDLIESGKKGKSSLIKSHHNVGLDYSVTQIEPFNKLFKYEVRDISRLLGLDKAISERKPFPGPGLYLRILGVPVTPELIEVVRFADDIVTNILKTENYYDEISQLIVALDGVKTVGIKGDARKEEYSIIIRPVKTSDFMTVKPFYLPPYIMEKITKEVTRHALVNRVFWDYTPKPPATMEFQ
jgi:GMP synthase (glutamine-hydrolysing)